MERGWVGRVDGDRVVHLAAQTIQHFFSGGASAREHAEYGRDGVTLLAPVLHPPAVRVFDDTTTFAFANPAAVVGPGTVVHAPAGAASLVALPRLVGVVGADGAIGGFTILVELRAEGLQPPKDRDFGLALGPVVVTPDELLGASLEAALIVDGEVRPRGALAGFDWEAARRLAAAGTHLRTGDLLAGPAAVEAGAVARAGAVAVDVAGIGTLSVTVA